MYDSSTGFFFCIEKKERLKSMEEVTVIPRQTTRLWGERERWHRVHAPAGVHEASPGRQRPAPALMSGPFMGFSTNPAKCNCACPCFPDKCLILFQTLLRSWPG